MDQSAFDRIACLLGGASTRAGPGYSSLVMTESAFITLNFSDDGNGCGGYSNNAGNSLTAPAGAIANNNGDECDGPGISC